MKSKLFLIGLMLSLNVEKTVRAENSETSSGPFHVIVSSKNPVETLDRSFVADVFFKKVTRWPNDELAQPVDLRPDASARRRFTEQILKRTVMGVKSYWQQLIFSGRDVPPPELLTDEDVIKYVAKHPNSIGYISGLPKHENRVKIVDVR